MFPAAILQPAFFDPNADANGVQRNCWTDSERAAFDAKADQLAEQYSQNEPISGNFVNGRNSLGENIGDVGGLSMAYHAYKLSLNGNEAPIIDGLTGDLRVRIC